jgi:hypothetical protein
LCKIGIETYFLYNKAVASYSLAPYLFIIALDYAPRRAIEGKEKQLGFTVTPRKTR